MAAQRVVLPAGEAFDYQWSGTRHYLALHDIRLRDGETFQDDGRPSRLRDLRGTITFAPAGSRIWGWSAPTSRPHWFTAVYFDPLLLEEEFGTRATSQLRPQLYLNDPCLRGTLVKLSNSLCAGSAEDRLYNESLCLLSLLELRRFQGNAALRATHPAGSLSRASERRIRDYIEANLHTGIGLNDLAALSGLSRFHFVRAFKAATAQTPYQFLLQRRIERARALLLEGKLSVAAVALQVGFRDATRFIRTFRRQTGSTPGSIRGR